jgi:hypothetical protein
VPVQSTLQRLARSLITAYEMRVKMKSS